MKLSKKHCMMIALSAVLLLIGLQLRDVFRSNPPPGSKVATASKPNAEPKGHLPRLAPVSENDGAVLNHPNSTSTVVSPASQPVIRGRVEDESGFPLHIFGVSVQMGDRPEPRILALSDADGRFEITLLQAGNATLVAEVDGYVQIHPPVPALPGDYVVLTVRREEEEGGTVWVEIVDGSGSGIPFATAAVISPLETHVPPGKRAASGPAGIVRLHVRSFGDYLAVTKAPGFAPGTSALFNLPKDGSAPVIKVVMSTGGRVAGVVSLDSGAPVAGLSIGILPTRSSAIPGPAIRHVHYAVTSGSGEFIFDNLAPGFYSLTPEPDPSQMTFLIPKVQVQAREGATSKVTMTARIKQEIAIVGKVYGDGRPMVGCRLEIESNEPGSSGDVEVVTDATGSFEAKLWGGGSYSLYLTANPDPNRILFAVKVPDVESHSLMLDYETSQLGGNVVGQNGEPAAGVTMKAIVKTNLGGVGVYEHRRVVTDASGSYSFSKLLLGECTIQARGPGTGPGGRRLTGTSFGGRAEPQTVSRAERLAGRRVDFRLTAGASIIGTVVGLGAEGDLAVIRCIGQSQRAIPLLDEIKADPSGHFEIHGLTPGEYLLRATSLNEASPWVAVTASVSGGGKGVLELQAGCRVTIEFNGASVESSLYFATMYDENHVVVGGASSSGTPVTIGPVIPGEYKLDGRVHNARNGQLLNSVERFVIVVAGEVRTVQLGL